MRATSRWSVTFLVCSIGCGGGGTDIITPPPPPAAEFVVTFVPDPEETTTSTALGWQSAIPGISGTIIPADSSVPARSFTASAQGKAALTGLTSGAYIIEAARWLTPTEEGRLGSSDDAIGYAGRWTVQIAAGSGSATMETPASRRKGLVISEWAFNSYQYQFGGFLELYNNADTTIYLDGMIVGEGWNASLAVGALTCENTAPFRNDPAGVWSRFAQQFPGTGRDFPVPPGGTIVVATDAIDHRPLYAPAIDLSSADFEFSGLADVDNPAVPNMIDVGVTSYLDGHGSEFFGFVQIPFLTLPVNAATLPRMRGPSGNVDFARFPGNRILDVFSVGTNYPPPAGPADCPPLVHPTFNRKESRARGTEEVAEYQFSLSRRRVAGAAGVVLQWTGSSNADLVRTARSPGIPGQH
jgi:hypothetical protein